MIASCGPSTPGPTTPVPLSTLTVNSNNDMDDGICNPAHCSLREAINKANTMAGTVTIKFNIGGGGPRTILLQSALPAVSVPVEIDGSSQPFFNGSSPLIELDGSQAGSGSVDGLVIGGGNSTVKSLAIIRFSGRGILINSSGNNTIQGCFIGVSMYGLEAGNQASGIVVASGSNTIGGTDFVHTRNVISGNHGDGVMISGALNSIEGNLIGLDAAGAAAIGNQGNGITMDGNINMVGGSAPEARNIISGNIGNGIRVNSDSNEIQNNFIGTDVSGTIAVGNQMSGIFVYGLGAVQIGGIDSTNIISANGLFGIWLDDSTNAASVLDNRIGTNKSGTAALGNIKGGVRVGGTNHQIGVSGQGNLISGNGGPGIAVVPPATVIKIQGNFIGTSADGESAVGNDNGVEIGLAGGTVSVLIGGSLYGEGNLVSGNHGEGLLLYSHAQVAGNRIGMDQSGLNELPNGGDGILIKGDNNLIGTPHEPNAIAHNGGHGVAVITESGSAGHNALSGNSIWDNGKLGIALGGDSVLANDPGDADTGDNNLQNYPVMVSAIHDPVAGQTTVTATLDSAPQTLFFVEFFVNTVCDPTGYGEGEQMAASKIVTTDAGGHADVTGIYEPYHFIAGNFITATATDSAGNTSEFSNCIPVTQASAGTPAPASGGMQFKPSVYPMAFFFGGCEPSRADITLEVLNPPEPINYTLLFVRLVDKKSGAAGAWSQGLSMSKLGATKFFFTLTIDKIPDNGKFIDAWLQYQFVAYNKSQKEIGRSEVFSDVSFGRCGGTGITPTPTKKPATHG
jgi:CSLREA domain-containing protein